MRFFHNFTKPFPAFMLCFWLLMGIAAPVFSEEPVIGSVSPAQTLYDGTTSATIWAEDITATGTIDRVWAVIIPPGHIKGLTDQSDIELPTVDLRDEDSIGHYEMTYDDFSIYGNYNIAIYAMDTDSNISLPKYTYVYQEIGVDVYEDNDNLDSANIIICQLGWEELYDVLTQRHNFHDEGDEDWVKFYGVAEEVYEMKTENLDANCDTVIMLYDEYGIPVFEEPRDDYGYGEDELFSWQCPEDKDGIYYVKVKQYISTDYGQDTGYDLKLYHPTQGIPGWLMGIVTNVSGDGIGDAVIKSDVSNTTTVSNDSGNYLMALPSGTHTISVDASGYQFQSLSGVEVLADNYTSQNFLITSEYFWNLISLDRQPENTNIEIVLDSIVDKVISVWAYVNGAWQVYDPENPGFSDLTIMEAGRGYWINMDESATLDISGTSPSHSIAISTGWNLVGYNSETSYAVDLALASIEGKYISVWAYIDGGWLVYDPENPGFSDLLLMEPGYGYWINAEEECTWTLP
jgi:hypothetical protein